METFAVPRATAHAIYNTTLRSNYVFHAVAASRAAKLPLAFDNSFTRGRTLVTLRRNRKIVRARATVRR